MRKVVPLIFFSCLVFASSTGMDSIPPNIGEEARHRTDSQLVELSLRQEADRLILHFDNLRDHLDSINATHLMDRKANAIITAQRDSVIMSMIRVLTENRELKNITEKQERYLNFMYTWPDVLFVFVSTFFAVLSAIGFVEGLKKYRLKKNKYE